MVHPSVKRFYDLCLAVPGLILISPGLLLLAVLIRIVDGAPVFYRQLRVGWRGRLFWIWKYRTMVVNAEHLGSHVTGADDARVTALGRLLRRWKLDELPQLWNVCMGEMSLVGPRPEVPRYMERYSDEQRQILMLKPGITDLATLVFRHEEELLRQADDVESFYIRVCVPLKVELNLEYARKSTLWSDTLIILRTVLGSFVPNSANDDAMRNAVSRLTAAKEITLRVGPPQG